MRIIWINTAQEFRAWVYQTYLGGVGSHPTSFCSDLIWASRGASLIPREGESSFFIDACRRLMVASAAAWDAKDAFFWSFAFFNSRICIGRRSLSWRWRQFFFKGQMFDQFEKERWIVSRDAVNNTVPCHVSASSCCVVILCLANKWKRKNMMARDLPTVLETILYLKKDVDLQPGRNAQAMILHTPDDHQ